MDSAPKLEGDALKAVRHRGSPLQIIASAGSGKTEVVSQRVADLLADGCRPEAIAAFTFTEKAAEELKRRILRRVGERLGKNAADRMNGCHTGTIHAFCHQLLQQHVPRYETCDVLDEHRLAVLLAREKRNLGIKDLNEKLFQSIGDFICNAEVVDNELIGIERLHPPFRNVLARLNRLLDTYRFLTYGQLIARAVEALDQPEIAAAVKSRLRHLIVDEYQDINPAQEALIQRLARPPVELCVVGDDDQSIYQWRGSDVSNIVNFARRYPDAAIFELLTNRRSRPGIIQAANRFGARIRGRLDKAMLPHRESAPPELVIWKAPTEEEEARKIALSILDLRRSGHRFRDIAVLVRSSTSYNRLMEAFDHHDIPIQPAGRTGLFTRPDARLFGRTFAHLVDREWRSERYGPGRDRPMSPGDLLREYTKRFQLDSCRRMGVSQRLANWKNEVNEPTRPADLVGEYYGLLANCGVGYWDFNDPVRVARLGTLARCSAILAGYESVRLRARPDEQAQGEMVGGEDRGLWYYRDLANHIQNWALGKFEGFEGEDRFTPDTVDLTTVHKAKGLEWPIVFVPCVSAKRFPSINTGKARNWHVPKDLFDRTRYEGTINDERRLFYVAMTRARDWLSLSTHDTPNKQRVEPSEFLLEVSRGDLPRLDDLPLPPAIKREEEFGNPLAVTFTELANFKSCGLSYRLRRLIGFQPSLAPMLGYGKAVHHILRQVAEHRKRLCATLPPNLIDEIFDEHFFLPAANRPTHRQLKAKARRLVDRYLEDYSEDLDRYWAVERPFELHLPNATVNGQADVILEKEDDVISSLAVVDYKTAQGEHREHELQLRIYASAGQREGLDVRAAYVHDLDMGERLKIDISPPSLRKAEEEAESIVDRLRERKFEPQPGAACSRCDVKAICKHAVG